jgi:hypothetical protein
VPAPYAATVHARKPRPSDPELSSEMRSVVLLLEKSQLFSL